MVPEATVKTAVTGCARKCPCRLWINCDYYTEEKKRQERSGKRVYNAEEWYSESFREEVRMPEICTSG